MQSMLRVGSWVVWSFLVLAAPALAQSHVLTLPHKEVVLPNGLRVFMVKYPSPGVVAYQVPVRAGSRNEVEKGKSGFAHFFEHLMFRGTKKRSSTEFGELYARLGCENNAWTWYDMTDYHGVVASVYLPQIMDAEADRFKNLYFDEKALRDEAGAVLGEYNKDVANPEFVMEEKLLETAFKVHPYGHTTMGYKPDVLKFTERYKDVWPFFKRYYRPGNVRVVLVGDVDFDRDLALIKNKFGDWKDPVIEPMAIPTEPPQTEPRVLETRLEKPAQTRLSVAYKVPAFTSKSTDVASLQLLAEMLFSVTSEFQKEYRFKRKWLDSVSAGPLETIDPGLWTISLRLSEAGEGKEKELLAAVDQVIKQAREPVASPEAQAAYAKRLESTKKRYRNAAVTEWFGTPDHLAGRIAWYTNFEPDLNVINRLFDRVAEVKASTLTAFARQYLVDAHKTTIILRGKQ